MDTKRLVLYGLFVLLSLSLWLEWQKDYPRQHPPVVAAKTPSITPEKSEIKINAPLEGTAAISQSENIQIKTDVLDLNVNTLGGDITSAKLLAYPENRTTPDIPVVLFNENPATYYIAQSDVGLNGSGYKPIYYKADKTSYRFEPGQSEGKLTVTLRGELDNKVDVIKTLILEQGSYVININYQLKNKSDSDVSLRTYNQITRKPPAETSSGLFGISSYTGPSISDPDVKRFQKVSFSELASENLQRTVNGGWVAMQQHYFLSAFIPESKKNNLIYSEVKADHYTIGLAEPEIRIAPGEENTASVQLYVGPENAERLSALAPGLNLTVDYGFLWFIAQPIFWVLEHIYRYVGNWGYAIILVTLLIKLMFYSLSAKSYRSMANMRKLQPQLEAIKKRYADDKQGLSQATLALYKKEKVNPLGGCLPILIQIPVFIALYWVLLESVELRQAPFIGWIHDLSAKDPYFVLPVLMGLSMLVQQKLNPPPPDPMQAKVMMFLPVMFTVLFLQFPAGLVLYWVVNNTVSILQQWFITRRIETASNVIQQSKA